MKMHQLNVIKTPHNLEWRVGEEVNYSLGRVICGNVLWSVETKIDEGLAAVVYNQISINLKRHLENGILDELQSAIMLSTYD